MSGYRKGQLKTVVRKLAKYNLDLGVVQGIRWGKGGTEKSRRLYCTLHHVIKFLSKIFKKHLEDLGVENTTWKTWELAGE
jgi:hypothetical protein